MTILRSPTFRAAALATMVPLVVAILGVTVVQRQLAQQLQEAAQTRLSAEMEGFAALYDQRRIPALREAIAYRAEQTPAGGARFLLLGREGTPLAGNLREWPAGLIAQDLAATPSQSPDGAAVRLGIDGADYLARALRLRGGFDLMAAVPLEPLTRVQTRMGNVFVLFGAVMLGAGLIGAALVAWRARARIARINRTLDGLGGPGGMGGRVPADENAGEYATLAAHVNAMLDRIAHLLDAHQRLGNAVAHEMRTPLARIQSRLLALDLDAAARAGLEDEIRATTRLFDALLSIAQMDAEAGNTAGLIPLDLGRVVREICDLYAPVAEETDRRLTCDAAPDAHVLGDAQLLSQLVSNLVENGLKYTRPGDVISVSVTRQGGRVTLRVADTGPGVDDDTRARLFTPFARGASTDATPGHGLGLSLVRAIALRHGAEPRLPRTEKGFALELDLGHFVPTPAR